MKLALRLAFAVVLVCGMLPTPCHAASATDTFTANDGTLVVNHTSDSGHSWRSIGGSANGNAVITANRVRAGGPYGHCMLESSFVPSSADYDVEADLVVQSVIYDYEVGIMGREVESGPSRY